MLTLAIGIGATTAIYSLFRNTRHALRVLVAAVATLATLLPAVRASCVPRMRVLREE